MSDQQISAEIREVLERVETGGDDGVPLVAPKELKDNVPAVFYGGSNRPTKTQQKKQASFAPYLQDLDRTEQYPFGRSQKRQKTSFVRLNAAGRQALADARQQDAEETLKDKKRLLEQLEKQADVLSQVRTSIDALRADAAPGPATSPDSLRAEIGRAVEDVLKKLLPSPADHPAERLLGAVNQLSVQQRMFVAAVQQGVLGASPTPLEAPAAPEPPPTEPTVLPPAVPKPSVSDLLDLILPPQGWIEIPRLRTLLAEHGLTLGPGTLADELRALHRTGHVRLGAWQKTASEIPRPEYALLGPNAAVLYYVSRGKTL